MVIGSKFSALIGMGSTIALGIGCPKSQEENVFGSYCVTTFPVIGFGPAYAFADSVLPKLIKSFHADLGSGASFNLSPINVLSEGV